MTGVSARPKLGASNYLGPLRVEEVGACAAERVLVGGARLVASVLPQNRLDV